MTRTTTTITPTEEGNLAPDDLRGALHRWFGFEDFRPGQEPVIRAVLRGEDTLALMPTGAGKSLCYQLPAMLLPGITLVVSPLIALMKDQYDSLPAPVYERSTFINSSLDLAELDRRLAEVRAGRIKLIYAAPERLRQQSFVHALAGAGIRLLVVDEAHCVSLWGHDFRPDYLFIGKALAALGAPGLLGMTATATPAVQGEIGTGLGRALEIVQTSPFRPNLFYQVQHLKHQREKVDALVRFCRDHKGSGIVYVRARRQAEQLADALRRGGVKAEYYHAGLEATDRSAVQERWMLDQTRVIVATIAFGMGIDKANVRFIVHFSPPDSLEGYAQESGRAGRDGRRSICLLLTTPGDRTNLTRWLREASFDVEQLRAIYRAVGRQVRAAGRPTLVSMGTLLYDAGEAAGRELTDTDLRVGLGLMERAGLLARHADAPSGVTIGIEGALFGTPDPSFAAFCDAAGLAPGRRADFRLADLADRLDTDPLEVERRLLTWRDAGRITLRSGAREPVIERLKAPADSGERMAALLAAYEQAQLARIDQLFQFTGGEECRHQVLARHLGHIIDRCGENCDNCRTGAARDAAAPQTRAEQTAQLDALLERLRAAGRSLPSPLLTAKRAGIIVDCVASLPFAITKTALAGVLVGRQGAPFTAAQVRGYGALQGLDRYDVPKQIDALVDLGYLAADTRSGQRLIGLGSAERVAAPPPVRARAPEADEGAWASPVLAGRRAAPPPADEPFDAPALPANPAQVMLECIGSLPFPMGRTGVAKVLVGAADSAVDGDRCRHYGALAMCTHKAVADALPALVDAGYLRQETRDKWPLLILTPKGRAETPPADLIRLPLKSGLDPEVRRRRAERETWRRSQADAAARLTTEGVSFDDATVADRMERLRLWRRTAAARENVPPYMVFHDTVLQALAEAPVQNLDDLRGIRGIGAIALGKYGADLLAILAVEDQAPAAGEPDAGDAP